MIRESSTSLPSSLHVKFYLPVGSRLVDKTSDQTVSPDAGQPPWSPCKLVFLVSFFHNYRLAVDVMHKLFNMFCQQLEQPLPPESSILGADAPFHGKLTISRPRDQDLDEPFSYATKYVIMATFHLWLILELNQLVNTEWDPSALPVKLDGSMLGSNPAP